MNAEVYTDYDQFEADAKPGSIFLAGEGERLWLHHHCPGCGERSGLKLFETVKPCSPSWKIEQRDPITLSPSVHHARELGGCGWHGFLQQGNWTSC